MGSDERHLPARIEWPTLLVALGCWGGWAAVLIWHESMPVPLVLISLALLNGWYMSLQHEVIHGHPTPWHPVNLALAWWPTNLWLPYRIYRDLHLQHHEIELAVPGVDPESFYVSPDDWARASALRRLLWRANRTLVGRWLIGPMIGPAPLIWSELKLARRDPVRQRMWLGHLLAVVAISWLVFGLAGVPVWMYLVGYVYLGMSVTYTRSFVEHLAVPAPSTRSAVVRSNPFFGVLFLYNNLHHTHHALPGAAWYRLPRLTEEMGSGEIAAEGAGHYRGYAEVFRRYGFRPFSEPVYPLSDRVSS